MPRTARKRSITGVYHVVSRGVNHQLLFTETADYEIYLDKLQMYSKEYGIRIIAYCLMQNHVHLLPEDPNGNLSEFMGGLNGSYALFFNKKYDRSGHLFESRFWSDPVVSEKQEMAVFRYILQNPERAGICRTHDYEWSSYMEYGDRHAVTDAEHVRSLFPTLSEYDRYVLGDAGEEGKNMYIRPASKPGDREAVELIRDYTGMKDPMDLQLCDRKYRNEALRYLKGKGLSARQIERLTGVGRSTALRA